MTITASSVKQFLNGVSLLEKILFVVFVIYLIFQVQTPEWLIPYANSSLGLVVIFLVVLYLFCYTTPILGVLSLFVAYELLRRSAVMPVAKKSIEDRTPSQKKKDVQLKRMNPPSEEKSLEENIVQKMAPIGVSEPSQYVESDYKPTSTQLFGGSLL